MKKLFSVTVILCCIQLLHGQTKIAIKGGYNYSTARVTQYQQKKAGGYNSGYGVGILFKAPFDGLLHFSPWVAYNCRGFKYNAASTPDSSFSNTMSYIDLVPALSIDFPAGENFIVLTGGFNVSVALKGKESITAGGTTTTRNMKFDIGSNYGIFDLGLNTGIGFHTKKIFIEALFNLGLADINNQYDADGRNIRNRMFSFNAGWYFR